jgi:hypothetical protein
VDTDVTPVRRQRARVPAAARCVRMYDSRH